MAEKANFPFVRKEGKYFAPIVRKEPVKRLVDGAIVTRDVPKSGVKGVYSKVRLGITTTERAELFAISTDAFLSSR